MAWIASKAGIGRHAYLIQPVESGAKISIIMNAELVYNNHLVVNVLDLILMRYATSETARTIQDTAIEYLMENGPESSRNAIALLKLGLETERASISIPDMMDKAQKMSDDRLLKEITEIAKDGELDLQPGEDIIDIE